LAGDAHLVLFVIDIMITVMAPGASRSKTLIVAQVFPFVHPSEEWACFIQAVARGAVLVP
jgi:hypothetical protein